MKLLLTCATLLITWSCYSADSSATPEKRPNTWATKPETAIPGLPNFHKVTPNLYRGAQPTAEGMQQLAQMGVKTVLSLRAFNEDDDLLRHTELNRFQIRFKTWHPEDEDVVHFLRIVLNPDHTPVFVHCQHGSDRTGTMIAIYRIAVQGWDKEEALREMTEGGYGYHAMWQNLKKYIRQLDIEQIKGRAGIERSTN